MYEYSNGVIFEDTVEIDVFEDSFLECNDIGQNLILYTHDKQEEDEMYILRELQDVSAVTIVTKELDAKMIYCR